MKCIQVKVGGPPAASGLDPLLVGRDQILAVVAQEQIVDAAVEAEAALALPEALAAEQADGVVAAGAQPLGDGDVARIHAQGPAVDAAADARRRQAGGDRRHRAPGHVRRREGPLEQGPARRQQRQVRRRQRPAVRPHADRAGRCRR